MGRIHIDKLNIRIKGLTPEQARQGVHGLGEEVLQQLAEQVNGKQRLNGPATVDHVQAGTVQIGKQDGPGSWRHQAVKQIVNSVQQQTGKLEQTR